MKYKGLVISRVIVLVLLLAACSPSDAQIATTSAQTELANPTATITPEPTATQMATPTKRPTFTLKPANTSTWDRYKPGTIGQIVSNTDPELASLADKAFYFNYGEDYATKTEVTYTGQFRPISERRTYLLGAWLAQMGRADAINLFTTEGLFVEGTSEYWLPIQSPLIPLMKDELTEGGPVTLFIIWIGATYFDKELDRVFLVNEFLAPAKTTLAVPPSTEEAAFTPNPAPLASVSPGVIDWEETISLPVASSAPFDDARGQQLIFHNGYVYIFGGAGAGEPRLTNVYFSAIGKDGGLAGWVETTPLPGKYYDHVVVKVGEYVYLLTGAAGAEDVYYAPFNADGSIGAWKKTAPLSPSRQQFAAASHGNFIYSTGGNSGGNKVFVQYTSVRPDGSLGPWTLTTSLPAAIQAHTMIAYDGYLYVFGGKNASD